MAAKHKTKEWRKLGEFVLLFVLLPIPVFYLLAQFWEPSLHLAYYILVTLFVIQAALSYLQSTASMLRDPWERQARPPRPPVPRASFLVSAYLPNELQVIEETLQHLLTRIERPAAGLEVILAYNTPHFLELELRLRELALQHPSLILANAHGSRSKSQNQNYALAQATGAIIVLLDADHRVSADCLSRAWRWLEAGYDVVQGRCSIRNVDDSLVTRLVGVEFQTIYGISHTAKFRLFHTALFGGSNGYWRAAALRATGFRNDRLTEDIDATLRATLAGHRFVHDRTIVSTEEAPVTWRGLWFQRKRWAQGWFQCSLAYQGAVLRSRCLHGREKFIWTMLLLWRVGYDLVSHLLLPVLVAYWLQRGRVELPVTPYILFALIFTLVSGPYETLAAALRADHRFPGRRYLLYAALSFPYTTYKNILQVIAIRDELAGHHEWIMTERQKKA
jgi:cellulose synthase/poly-beta-1,6-N-acetylglucosamine synthase-like glycosyltransferase